MIELLEKTDEMQVTTKTRFPRPVNGDRLDWYKWAEPAAYSILLVQAKGAAGADKVDVVFIDRKTADIVKDAQGKTMAPVTIDLNDRRIAWRKRPSTIDKAASANPASADCALLCLSEDFLQTLVDTGKVVMAAGDQVKYPYGHDGQPAKLMEIVENLQAQNKELARLAKRVAVGGVASLSKTDRQLFESLP